MTTGFKHSWFQGINDMIRTLPPFPSCWLTSQAAGSHEIAELLMVPRFSVLSAEPAPLAERSFPGVLAEGTGETE